MAVRIRRQIADGITLTTMYEIVPGTTYDTTVFVASTTI